MSEKFCSFAVRNTSTQITQIRQIFADKNPANPKNLVKIVVQDEIFKKNIVSSQIIRIRY